ncbi:hypothetical protein OAJ27_00010 [bacterium]|nr:hypothetical protein [bacterium]
MRGLPGKVRRVVGKICSRVSCQPARYASTQKVAQRLAVGKRVCSQRLEPYQAIIQATIMKENKIKGLNQFLQQIMDLKSWATTSSDLFPSLGFLSIKRLYKELFDLDIQRLPTENDTEISNVSCEIMRLFDEMFELLAFSPEDMKQTSFEYKEKKLLIKILSQSIDTLDWSYQKFWNVDFSLLESFKEINLRTVGLFSSLTAEQFNQLPDSIEKLNLAGVDVTGFNFRGFPELIEIDLRRSRNLRLTQLTQLTQLNPKTRILR